MTSSGTATFNPTIQEIITEAYQKLGTLPIEEQASNAQLVTGRRNLNMMLKAWMGTGLHVWTTEEAILFTQASQPRYSLGLTSSDHMTDAYDFASTTLTANKSSGATTLTVASIADIASADYLGIELDSGSFQWTTVNGAPSGTTVTPTAALTGAASSGNRVIAYTSKIIRPLKIVSGRAFKYDDERETEMDDLSHLDYQRLPLKSTTSSQPVQWHYQPKLPLGIMNIYSTPSDVAFGVRFTYHRPIYDVTASTETADVPAEWQEALVYNLALRLSTNVSCPADRLEKIEKMAQTSLGLVLSYDREPQSILFQPDFEGMGDE